MLYQCQLMYFGGFIISCFVLLLIRFVIPLRQLEQKISLADIRSMEVLVESRRLRKTTQIKLIHPTVN